jgi:PST family polysaccharide transporter
MNDLPGAAAPAAGRDSKEFDRSFVRNVFWTGAAKAVSQVVGWVSSFIVARLLTPDDYGLVGMATVFLGVVMLVSESGIGITIVTLRTLDREQVAQLNTVAVLLGVAGFLACCAAAVPLGWFFRSEALPPVVVALGAAFVISGFRVVPNALLQQDLRFKLLGSLEAVNVVILAASMVILALAGYRYWTLVIGTLLGAVTMTSLTVALRPLPFRWPRWASLRAALAFTRDQLGGNLLWYWYASADQVVAGRLLGKADLGVYSLALTIANSFSEKVTTLITQITPAYFAALQEEPAALKRYLLRLTEVISVVTFPALLGLSAVADDFVRVVLGTKWLEMVDPLRLLAIYAAIGATSPLLSRVLTVRGQTRFLLRNALVLAVVMPVSFAIGSQWGPTGIAWAWVLVFPLTRIPIFRRVATSLDVSGREYLGAFWPATSASLVMVAAVMLLQVTLAGTEMPLGVRLLLEILCGACVYAGFVLAFHRQRIGIFFKLRDAWRRQDASSALPPS